jgi:hypothetical protein
MTRRPFNIIFDTYLNRTIFHKKLMNRIWYLFELDHVPFHLGLKNDTICNITCNLSNKQVVFTVHSTTLSNVQWKNVQYHNENYFFCKLNMTLPCHVIEFSILNFYIVYRMIEFYCHFLETHLFVLGWYFPK